MSLFFKKKVAKTDFTEDNLPKNRKEVFFDVLKIRWSMILRLGLLLLLFSAPLIILLLIKDISISNAYSTISEEIAAQTITQEEGNATLLALYNVYNLIEIVCLIIAGLGGAGAIRVVRQLAWGEPVFFHQDFFDGIKMNGGHYALIFFIIGVFNFLNVLVYNSLSQNSSTLYQIMAVIPSALCLTLFIEIAEMMMGMVPVYTNKFRYEVKNGFILYLKSLPKTLLMTLILIIIPFVFKYINIVQVKYLGLIVYIIAIAPFEILGMFLYEMSIFDRYININQYPDIFDRGVFRPEAEKKALYDKYHIDPSILNGSFEKEEKAPAEELESKDVEPAFVQADTETKEELAEHNDNQN